MKENGLLFHCVPLLLVFLQRRKEKNKEKERSRSKKSKQCRVTGQTRCCTLCKKERARNAIRGEKQRTERHHNHQPTLERRPTLKRQIIVRSILMHFFCVLFILVMSCPFYSLFLSCACFLAPHFAFACSLLSTCALPLSLSLHTHTISVQGHNKKEEEDKREREERRH
jgi:hypothetical protein